MNRHSFKGPSTRVTRSQSFVVEKHSAQASCRCISRSRKDRTWGLFFLPFALMERMNKTILPASLWVHKVLKAIICRNGTHNLHVWMGHCATLLPLPIIHVQLEHTHWGLHWLCTQRLGTYLKGETNSFHGTLAVCRAGFACPIPQRW